MSEPRNDYAGLLYGAIKELTSAMSSLNMPPEKLEYMDGSGFLSEIDKWANHSYAHMEMAIELLHRLNHFINYKHDSDEDYMRRAGQTLPLLGDH